MGFEGLWDGLEGRMEKMGGKGKVSEGDMKRMMGEVGLALLEGDVKFKVVKELVKSVCEGGLG
uniref:signal recognition particle receptor subunit alpha n=1 Tax=Staphylococcus capitis TaxID=29388 RepID=UPI0011A3F85B